MPDFNPTHSDLAEIEYPIPARNLRGDHALLIVCAKCHSERVIDADEIYNEDIYECPADTERGRTASIEPRCGGAAQMKYAEGDVCPNCRRLGFFEDALDRCCSRSCKLQAEYAATLGARP